MKNGARRKRRQPAPRNPEVHLFGLETLTPQQFSDLTGFPLPGTHSARSMRSGAAIAQHPHAFQ